MFKYGSFKLLLLKVFFGFFLISLSSFLIISIISHSPDDPSIGKLVGNEEIANIFGFWGSVSSGLFLILFGSGSMILST